MSGTEGDVWAEPRLRSLCNVGLSVVMEMWFGTAARDC